MKNSHLISLGILSALTIGVTGYFLIRSHRNKSDYPTNSINAATSLQTNSASIQNNPEPGGIKKIASKLNSLKQQSAKIKAGYFDLTTGAGLTVELPAYNSQGIMIAPRKFFTPDGRLVKEEWA